MTGALVKFLKDTEPEVRTAAAFKVTGDAPTCCSAMDSFMLRVLLHLGGTASWHLSCFILYAWKCLHSRSDCSALVRGQLFNDYSQCM
jgi:hypothetical protein